MKAKSLLIAMALSLLAGGAIAQSRDTISLGLIPYHYTGGGAIGVKNLMKQHDGSFVCRLSVIDHINSGYYPPAVLLGTSFYKFAPTGAEITDSLFVPGDAFNRYYMLDKNPQGVGNLRVSTEPDGEGGTNLRIAHFPDDDFIGNISEDVVVSLCEEVIHSFTQGMIDCRGDLIWTYLVPVTDSTWESHIARFGLDGTRKHDAVMPEGHSFLPFGIFSEFPLKYYLWDGDCYYHDNLSLYVYDSLFQLKNSYMISRNFLPDESYVYFEFNNSFSQTFLVPDCDDVLVAAPYSDYSTSSGTWPVYDSVQRGVAVARYDLRTMQQKGLAMFNDYPGPNTMTIPMCLFKSADGCLYFVYRETVWLDNGMEDPTPITAVKMDPNLNVLWTRYIDTSKGYQMDYVSCQVAEEKEDEVKIAVVGRNTYIDKTTIPYTYTQGLLYFCLSEKETSVGISGEGMEVRPYCFYPNPVQARLQMQFSPDVQPKHIELYDLQGRLVRTQQSNFGSIDMSQLSAGTYMMRVTMEDGKTYSDKVVKE